MVCVWEYVLIINNKKHDLGNGRVKMNKQELNEEMWKFRNNQIKTGYKLFKETLFWFKMFLIVWACNILLEILK